MSTKGGINFKILNSSLQLHFIRNLCPAVLCFYFDVVQFPAYKRDCQSAHELEQLNVLTNKVANEQRNKQVGFPSLVLNGFNAHIECACRGLSIFQMDVSHTQHSDVKHSIWHVRLACPHVTSMKCCSSLGLQFNEHFMLDQVWNPACISENRHCSAMNCLNPQRFTMMTPATPQRMVTISCVAHVANTTNPSLGIRL